MPLREVALKIGFRGGVETKSDEKTVVSTQLLVLENGVFGRSSSIKKCNGYEALSSAIDGAASVVTGAIRAAVREPGELLEFTPSRCYSRQTGADQWSDAGAVYSVVGTDRPLVKTGTQQLQPDHATLDGVTVAAWEDSAGGVWWNTVDATSGRIYRVPTQADALGIAPRCVASGTNLHVYYAVPTTGRIMVLVVNPAAPSAAVTPAILVDDLDSVAPSYDACPTTLRTGTPSLIAWFEAGAARIRFGYVDQSGALGTPILGHPSVVTLSVPARVLVPSPIAVAFFGVDGGTSDVILVGFIRDTSINAVVLSYSGGDSSTGIAFTGQDNMFVTVSAQRMALVCTSATQGAVAVEEAAAQPSNVFTYAKAFVIPIPSVPLAFETIRSVGLASRAFAVNGDAFAVFVHDTTYFNTYVTLRISGVPDDGFIAIGRHVPASAAGLPLRRHLSSAHVDGDVTQISLPVRERLISENNDKFRETGIRLFTLDFDSEDSHQYAQLGRGLYLAGACAQHYDSRRWTEQGFHFGPELIVTVNGSGGSLTTGTTYLYRAWYESTDFQGEVHRGPTSAGTLITTGASDTQVTLTLPTLRVTGKTNVRICVARSLAAKTGSTAKLFRITSLDPTTSGAVNGYVANSTSVDTVSFIDRMSDVDLALQEELYTDGGILSNDPAPLGSVVFRGQNRLFFTDPSNGTTVRFSQPIDEGYGVEIPPDLQLSVDPFGGDVTAGAFQDGRGVLWKASSIFLFQGDGPAPNGDTTVGGFSTPQLITSDVGCTDPSSIVLTPNGHMFKSAKGIYLLARDGQISYVGAPVEAYNAQAVRRATVMPDRTAVTFLTDSGLTLIYDYYVGQWSTRTNHEGLDAAVVSNRYHYLRTDGRVFRETIGSFSDAGERIRLRLVTAWIHLHEQLQGFQRIWFMHLLGTWQSPHQLGIRYQTDYTPGFTDTWWLDATGLLSSTGWITGTNAAPIGVDPIVGTGYGDGEYGDGPYGGTQSDVYQWRLHMNEKGMSVQFGFEDFEAEGFEGASFELTEMVLTGGAIAPAPRPFIAARST